MLPNVEKAPPRPEKNLKYTSVLYYFDKVYDSNIYQILASVKCAVHIYRAESSSEIEFGETYEERLYKSFIMWPNINSVNG